MPRKVILFGRQVSDFVATKLNLEFGAQSGEFDFPIATSGDIQYLSAYHPSYVLVYKRRKLDLYKSALRNFVDG